MSTIYEINPDGSASVAEPKSKRAGAAILGSALLAASDRTPPNEGWSAIRRDYFRIVPDDSWRAGHPNHVIPLDERIDATESELAAVRAAGKNASGRAAEILRGAADELHARLAMLRSFVSEFASCETAFRAAENELVQANHDLTYTEPDECAANMIAIERARAGMRKAQRIARALIDGFQNARKPVLPQLGVALASVEKVRQLEEERSREIASRSADVAALCEAIEQEATEQ